MGCLSNTREPSEPSIIVCQRMSNNPPFLINDNNDNNLENNLEIRNHIEYDIPNVISPEEYSQLSPMAMSLFPYLQSKNDPYFNFKEVDQYVGQGMKRMKGYISTVSEKALLRKREAFWGTRVEGNRQIWKVLQGLCELNGEEEKNIPAMLEAYGVVPFGNCINITYDSAGALYEIPNYCINMPFKYEEEEKKEKEEETEEEIKFYCRKGIDKIKVKCSNHTTVEEVKRMIGKKMKKMKEKMKNIGDINDMKDMEDIGRIRLFFRGKELEDKMKICNYKIVNGVVVIVMIKYD